jgi:hypothetical protein
MLYVLVIFPLTILHRAIGVNSLANYIKVVVLVLALTILSSRINRLNDSAKSMYLCSKPSSFNYPALKLIGNMPSNAKRLLVMINLTVIHSPLGFDLSYFQLRININPAFGDMFCQLKWSQL